MPFDFGFVMSDFGCDVCRLQFECLQFISLAGIKDYGFCPQAKSFGKSDITNHTIEIETVFHIALVEPEIPPNTGNIARLCAATFSALHIVGVTGFRMDDRTLKRAGLDYWNEVELFRHIDLERLYTALPDSRFLYFTTKTDRRYTDWQFKDGDCLVFGPETRGLPEALLAQNREHCLTIPMPNKNVRSLNLANSVGIVLYEAIRQGDL